MQAKGLVGLAAFVMADMAEAKVFDCAIKSGAAQGRFITERYLFDYDAEAQRVQAIDAVIDHFTGGPIPGKVSEDTNSCIAFTWSVKFKTEVGQQAGVLYTAAYI
jgi:hypothetical protein